MFGWLRALKRRKEPEAPPPMAGFEAALAAWRAAGRPPEQVKALEAVAACGDADARAVLEEALANLGSPHAQIAAARLLGERGDPAAIAALERAADPTFWRESEQRRAQGYSGFGTGPDAGLKEARRDESAVKTACAKALEKLKR